MSRKVSNGSSLHVNPFSGGPRRAHVAIREEAARRRQDRKVREASTETIDFEGMLNQGQRALVPAALAVMLMKTPVAQMALLYARMGLSGVDLPPSTETVQDVADSSVDVWRAPDLSSPPKPTVVAVRQTGLSGPESFTQARVRANPNPAVALAAVVDLHVQNRPAQATIELTDRKTGQTSSYSLSDLGDAVQPSHDGYDVRLPIWGMRPDRDIAISFELTDAEGSKVAESSQPLVHHTPPLPNDGTRFPQLHVAVSHPEKMAPGLTLFNPRRRPVEGMMDRDFGLIVATDAAGEVVWSYETDARISDFTVHPNGNIVYSTWDHRIFEVDRLGNAVHRYVAAHRPGESVVPEGYIPIDADSFHHAVKVFPNGDLLALSTQSKVLSEYEGESMTFTAMGDRLLRIDPEDGHIVWEWNAFEHFDLSRMTEPEEGGYWSFRGFDGYISDWTHINAVEVTDTGVLLSSRLQNALFEIDSNTGDVRWIAGRDDGWSEGFSDKLVTLEGGSWYSGQHGPSYDPKTGLLAVMDNDLYRSFDEPRKTDAIHSRPRLFSLKLSDESHQSRLTEIWSPEVADRTMANIAMGNADIILRAGQPPHLLASYGQLANVHDLQPESEPGINHAPIWTRIAEWAFDDGEHAEPVFDMRLRPADEGKEMGWALFAAHRVPEIGQWGGG